MSRFRTHSHAPRAAHIHSRATRYSLTRAPLTLRHTRPATLIQGLPPRQRLLRVSRQAVHNIVTRRINKRLTDDPSVPPPMRIDRRTHVSTRLTLPKRGAAYAPATKPYLRVRRFKNTATQPVPPVRVVKTPSLPPQPAPMSEADRIVQEPLRQEERERLWRERKACTGCTPERVCPCECHGTLMASKEEAAAGVCTRHRHSDS